MLRQNVFVHFQTFRRVLLARCSQHLPPPHLSFSFCVLILGTKNGTCLSDGPALPGFQKRTLTYSFFERIDCSGHLKSESAVLWVHWCDPGLRGLSVGWRPQNHILAGCSPKKALQPSCLSWMVLILTSWNKNENGKQVPFLAAQNSYFGGDNWRKVSGEQVSSMKILFQPKSDHKSE